MDEKASRQFILQNVSVTRQKITLAKDFFLKNFQRETQQLIAAFLKQMAADLPSEVAIGDEDDNSQSLKPIAESISWKACAGEALWDLYTLASFGRIITRTGL